MTVYCSSYILVVDFFVQLAFISHWGVAVVIGKLVSTSLERIKDDLYLPGGELNPGLPRDRRGYWPLYYRGITWETLKMSVNLFELRHGMSTVKPGRLSLSISFCHRSKQSDTEDGSRCGTHSVWPWIAVTISMCVVVSSVMSGSKLKPLTRRYN